MLMNPNKEKSEIGSITILVLVLGLSAGIIIGGLVLLAATQFTLTRRATIREQALAIAEAGIHYYRWHMSHDPSDYTDGTGQPGPYIHEYADPQGNVIGSFSLLVTPPASGSTFFTITSTGWHNDLPMIKRTIEARYGIPSLAKFAFLHNSNVWFGQGMTIQGPVFSNGGIRQDGVNTSTLSTTKDSYTCGVETGCEIPEVKPGIWGNGGPSQLWNFPATGVDFNSIIIDFNIMKTAAQSSGLYLGPSGKQGYHVRFNADGSFSVHIVETTDFYKGWSFDYGCQNLYQKITNETFLGTYQVANSSVIFFEDQVWVEGTLNGQTTLIAARFPIDSFQKDIWIPDNLVYLDRSGTHRLGLIAQRDIIFTKDVPDDFEVDGALLAQSSRILRHHYNYSTCKQGNPANKNSLTIYGSVISNLISYWNFSGGGSQQPTSGFVKRDIIYDPNLYISPPPYFPSSGDLELIEWNETDNP